MILSCYNSISSVCFDYPRTSSIFDSCTSFAIFGWSARFGRGPVLGQCLYGLRVLLINEVVSD